MIKLSNVLVATDFGPASDAALRYGREFARTFNATLHVLHVVEAPVLTAGPEFVGIDVVTLRHDFEAAAQNALDRLVTAEDRAQLDARTMVRTGRSPALEIVDYARSAAIDLIIIGTHGRKFVSHLIMGSVAERVVRLAGCPVLTVRHPEHEFIVPDAMQVVAKSHQ